MTRFRLSLAVATALVALCACASAAEAAASSWPYVVTSVSGSATWQYQMWNGAGRDSVKFQGHLLRGQAASALRGTATYTDQNSHRCGPVTSTRKMSFGDPLAFAIESGNYVDVTWNLPLPGESRCYTSRLTHVGALFRRDGFLSEKVPLAKFDCPTPVLSLQGRVRYSANGTIGWLTYKATVTLRQR